MSGPCERCGDHSDTLYRQVAGEPTWWDKMVCPRCVMLPPPFRYRQSPPGCTRCGSFYELTVDHLHVDGQCLDVRLCSPCRAAADEENQAAASRRQL